MIGLCSHEWSLRSGFTGKMALTLAFVLISSFSQMVIVGQFVEKPMKNVIVAFPDHHVASLEKIQRRLERNLPFSLLHSKARFDPRLSFLEVDDIIKVARK
ncbi:hypothetical protein KKB68_01265 [Patescibacteria group bacterium]|nr:hypothetical protein [Patescibacteria group bacterium]